MKNKPCISCKGIGFFYDGPHGHGGICTQCKGKGQQSPSDGASDSSKLEAEIEAVCRWFNKQPHELQGTSLLDFIKSQTIRVWEHNETVRGLEAQRDSIFAELNDIKENWGDPDLMEWVADRLVHVHGESNNVDYIHALRKRSENKKRDNENRSQNLIHDDAAKAIMDVVIDAAKNGFTVKFSKTNDTLYWAYV